MNRKQLAWRLCKLNEYVCWYRQNFHRLVPYYRIHKRLR